MKENETEVINPQIPTVENAPIEVPKQSEFIGPPVPAGLTESKKSKNSNLNTNMGQASHALSSCVLNHQEIINMAKNTKFTMETLDHICDFKFITKAHFTAYFSRWPEGSTFYAGLSDQYKGKSSGIYGDPVKKSFLNNGSEIYKEFTEPIVKKYNQLREAIVETSSNISDVKNKMESYREDVSKIKINNTNSKLQENIDMLMKELDVIQKIFN